MYDCYWRFEKNVFTIEKIRWLAEGCAKGEKSVKLFIFAELWSKRKKKCRRVVALKHGVEKMASYECMKCKQWGQTLHMFNEDSGRVLTHFHHDKDFLWKCELIFIDHSSTRISVSHHALPKMLAISLIVLQSQFLLFSRALVCSLYIVNKRNKIDVKPSNSFKNVS